ncbi:MAG: response regulator transcription factor [Bacteroidales bacterium]
MKILVCEDDLITLKAIEYSFKKEGYEVITAEDGKVGADRLREYRDEIDVMITDQHMPYFSGLELVHLARIELKVDFPIIMLTRVNQEETKQRAYSLGVSDYITKPFLPGQLLLRVKNVLK